MLVLFLFLGGDCIKIHLKLTGLIAASLGYREKDLDIWEKATAGEIFESLNIPISKAWIRFAVNGCVCDKNHVLRHGDIFMIFPVGGGG